MVSGLKKLFLLKNPEHLSKKEIRAEGYTREKKFLQKQWAKKKIRASRKSPTPHITFLMVRPLQAGLAINRHFDQSFTPSILRRFIEYLTKDSKCHFPFSNIFFSSGDI